MRLHRLRITAFGPFGGTVDVDFDALSADGIFLLTGPTGAGKTSVLDAVCFALYGSVPGERHLARQLRSQHAGPGVRPEVELELTLAGRQLHVVRSPAWQRPKKRGAGHTTEQARVTLTERRGPDWVPLTNRLDEAGHLLSNLLGMNAGQFLQVAMLPQGEFASFLRASSGQRHEVLEKLFRTHRFTRVVDWLTERRRALAQESASARAEVDRWVQRLCEVGEVGSPPGWSEGSEPHDDADSRLREWATTLLGEARASAVRCDLARREALARWETCEANADAVRHRVDACRRGHAAARAMAELERSAPEAATAERRLDLSLRAAPVAPLSVLAGRAAARAEEARRDRDRTLLDVATLLHEEADALDGETLQQRRDEARRRQTVAESFLPREAELLEASTLVDQLHEELAHVTSTLAGLDARVHDLPPEVAALDARLEAVALEAESAGLTSTRAEELQSRLGRALQLAETREGLREVRARRDAAREDSQTARDQLQEARQARLDTMALELATKLAVGEDCPVCGSAEHPSPAHGTSRAADDERVAQAAYDDAQVAWQAAEGDLRSLESSVAALEGQVGDDTPDGVRRQLGEARAAEARAGRAWDEHAAILERRTRLAQELLRARDERQETAVRLAALDAEHTAAVAARSAAERAVATVLAGMARDALDDASTGHRQTLQAVADTHARHASALDEARAAWQRHAQAAQEAEVAAADASSVATEAGFSDADEAEAAALTDAEAGELRLLLTERSAAAATAEATLSDPDVAAAMSRLVADGGSADDPDEALRRATDDAAMARAELDRAQSEDTRATERSSRLQALALGLTTRLDEWLPLRAEHVLTAGLAACAAGTAADNSLRMSLSAYVLAERLRQVVAAANERLTSMCDHRYTLEHADERAVGETRGGLSLRVRDEWTQDLRDPATLSGGESFVVSLALALGLADVVAHEAGGADIDTLFVDEGFGSLDADTLEQVLDVLDTLRDHGRAVGVVSHVSEMRNRIRHQLQVTKTRQGSSVHQRAASA